MMKIKEYKFIKHMKIYIIVILLAFIYISIKFIAFNSYYSVISCRDNYFLIIYFVTPECLYFYFDCCRQNIYRS